MIFTTQFEKDLNTNRILVNRGFNAKSELVWQAWTTPELLDHWWAPKPFKTETQRMDFRTGGHWFYHMVGPDGTRHYCKAAYGSIIDGSYFEGDDLFTDEHEVVLANFPKMFWKVTMKAETGESTMVHVEIIFPSREDLEKTVEMGFQEGFTMAHGNLDELLASL